MGVQPFELRGMIDQALGHPEKGIVNLNILHSLLHEILNRLDNHSPEKTFHTKERDEIDCGLESTGQALLNAITQTTKDQTSKIAEDEAVKPHENLSSDTLKLRDYEERIASIETKLKAWNSFLADQSFPTKNAQPDQTVQSLGSNENALAMMWKYMTTHRRLQATEEAVEKVMNILNGALTDIDELKKTKSKMAEDFEAVKKSGELGSNLDKFASLNGVVFKHDLAPFVTWFALEQALNKKEVKSQELSCERPDTAPQPSNPREVTEDQPAQTAMSPKEFSKLTAQDANEFEKFTNDEEEKEASVYSKENSLGEISLNHDENVRTRENTLDSINQLSPGFLNQLNRIGELPNQHDDVAVQVSTMSELHAKLASEVHKVEADILPKKVNKEDLQFPEDLLQQIDMLKEGLDILNTNQDLHMLATIKETSVQNRENVDSLKRELAMISQHLKKLEQQRQVKTPEANLPSYDNKVLNSVREKLNNVEEEQEKMIIKSKEDVEKILESLDEKQKVIDELFEYAERLEEMKADRENVANEMDVKADKYALEDKVNQSTFDETFQIFDKGLQKALQKMEDYMNEEMALKDTLSRISHEMEGKIDNDSLKLMKDYFEKQIKDVQESRDKFARETRVDAVDAAGVRRKLPIQYHCISCNRPVELQVRDSQPTLPESESLPFRRMKFPFNSYEVDQLRQKPTKGSCNADGSAAIRDHVPGRPCGGSHTVVNSQLRKSTKLYQFNHTMAVREHQRSVPKMVREVSVLDYLRGSDGHYYKGRSRQILPAIPRCAKYPSNADVGALSHKTSNDVSQEDTSHDQRNAATDTYRLRTPSPPAKDNLSSSYPERSEHKIAHKQGGRYSSDDLSIPSKAALNQESLKIFRRRRLQDKEIGKKQLCWDNERTDTKEQSQDQCSDDATSVKSMKRTTPVGEEQPHTSAPEGSPHRQDIHQGISRDMSGNSGNSDQT